MPAYVIADIEVHDPETYKEYAALVRPAYAGECTRQLGLLIQRPRAGRS